MKRANQTTQQQGGFTLIELLLAMALFSSILLLATLLLMQTLNIYNKGITVKQMNQVGRTLMEELSQVSNSGKSVTVAGLEEGTVSCIAIDTTAYVWNTATTDSTDTDGYSANLLVRSSDSNTPINFAKRTTETSGTGCAGLGNNIPSAELSPILGDRVRVYDMTVTKISDTNLVRISMTLGTFDGPGSSMNLIEDEENGFVCGPDSNFCAKAKFETVLYVPNGEFN